MAAHNLALFLIISTFFLLSWTSNIQADEISATNTINTDHISDSISMVRRLKLDEAEPGSANCWASLLELQSCTGEVIQFFYDGETYLGPGCCRAIRIIEHHCWPSMLTALGFTSQEGDILRGYCDSEEDAN